MPVLDSWILIAFVFSCGVVFVLLIDILVAKIVRTVNKLNKKYNYARMYSASRRMAIKIALRRN